MYLQTDFVRNNLSGDIHAMCVGYFECYTETGEWVVSGHFFADSEGWNDYEYLFNGYTLTSTSGSKYNLRGICQPTVQEVVEEVIEVVETPAVEAAPLPTPEVMTAVIEEVKEVELIQEVVTETPVIAEVIELAPAPQATASFGLIRTGGYSQPVVEPITAGYGLELIMFAVLSTFAVFGLLIVGLAKSKEKK